MTSITFKHRGWLLTAKHVDAAPECGQPGGWMVVEWATPSSAYRWTRDQFGAAALQDADEAAARAAHEQSEAEWMEAHE